ncbi:hypothetical protein MXB_4300 [Myxobolus squamalis]|nr:hypothetical protein MXB_4300 [Myxobolus squamalis]
MDMTKYYRCMHYDSKMLHCTADIKKKGVHNCISQQENLQVEACEYVKRYIKRQESDLSKNPDEIYRLLLQDLASEYSLTAITIPSKKRISNQILYKRRNENNHSHYEFV